MINRVKLRITAYWFALILVIILVGLYGREIVVWVISKLYGFFIEHNPVFK